VTARPPSNGHRSVIVVRKPGGLPPILFGRATPAVHEKESGIGEEAVNLCVSHFKEAKITRVTRLGRQF